MKKQFLFLAAIFITVIIVSCSKQGIENPGASQQANEEISASNSSSRPYVDPLSIKLEAWYKFDNNLKDATGKSEDGIPTKRAAYGPDKNNNAKGALSFTGDYIVKLPKIKQQTATSLSVWISSAFGEYDDAIIYTKSKGPFILINYANGGWGSMDQYMFMAGVSVTNAPPYVSGTTSFPSVWRHYAITYDGNVAKVYVNGNLLGSSDATGSIEQTLVEYFLGSPVNNAYPGKWIGYMDNLRFYSRTLTPTDVQALYNLGQ